MKKLLFAFLITYAVPIFPGSTEKRAMRTIRQALSKVPEVKQAAKKLERKTLKALNLDNDDLKYLAPAAGIVSGTIGTPDSIPLRIKVQDGYVVPRAEYRYVNPVQLQLGIFFTQEF